MARWWWWQGEVVVVVVVVVLGSPGIHHDVDHVVCHHIASGRYVRRGSHDCTGRGGYGRVRWGGYGRVGLVGSRDGVRRGRARAAGTLRETPDVKAAERHSDGDSGGGPVKEARNPGGSPGLN